MRRKKVFVTGCFDMLHSGHIFFLEQAATFGDLYVGIGSDETVRKLKGRHPVFNQAERRYVLDALKCVQKCFVNSGSGIMDFCKEIRQLSPDIFVVSEGADVPAKAQLCRDLGINYLVLKRESRFGHLKLSPTDLKRVSKIPYRLDLAGGWLDQAFVSKHSPGPVLTICVEPTIHFSERSGMASSSRRRAIELWQTEIPLGDREKLAKLLFSFENPPGSQYFSGSQDAIGIVFPGLNRLDYNGQYWPERIMSVQREEILIWLESTLAYFHSGRDRLIFKLTGKGKQISLLQKFAVWVGPLIYVGNLF